MYHLFTAVRRKVEDKDCEEGDAHARDDQVHLQVEAEMEKA